MNRLKKGQLSPNFIATNYLGQEVKLESYKGKKVLLSFHVFASCPFCNLRINELAKKYREDWSEKKFEMMHIFPSKGEKVAEFAGKNSPPYVVIANPNKSLYQLFGVKKSVIGMLFGFFKIKRLMKAFNIVGLFKSLSNNGSAMHQLPADFLIDENGIIQEAFYAKTTSDNLSIERIESFITKPLRVA